MQHPLGHGINVQIRYGGAGEVVFFLEIRAYLVGAAGPHGNHLRLWLLVGPPTQHVGVDLLVDDPLFPRVIQTKVPRLGPGG